MPVVNRLATPSGASLVDHWPIHSLAARTWVGTILVGCSCRISDKRSFLMHTADRFLKFATECQVMAQLAPQRENEQTWNRLAERWLRCAKLTEQLDTELRSSELRRRQKHLKSVAH